MEPFVAPPVLAARTTEESGAGGGKKTAHVESGPNGGQFTSSPGSKATPKPPVKKGPVPKRSQPASGSQVTPIAKKRQTLSLKGPNDPEQVKQLQALMKELKISGLNVDGVFGTDTEAAVKAVQTKLGLKPTGRCSASLLGTLEKVHALSPCVVRASSQVIAAAGPVGGYDDDEVVDKVEIAPGTWVCAHADGTVSMRMGSEPMVKWAGAVLEMAAEADDDGNGAYVEARRSYPGQKWRHGWIPFGGGKSEAPKGPAPADVRPTSMSDLAAELEGLTDDEQRAKLEAWGYSPWEITQLLGPIRVDAAAGHDTTLGHDELHHYWTRGEGLARWIESPTPWTTLVNLLSKHVSVEKAKRFASEWLHEVTGNWPGSDAHRVATGHKPRGSKVGPG